MQLKHKPNDFRVQELLKNDYLSESGAHHVYRVIKRKLTSLEAAEILAELAAVPAGDVSMAGLKDRQGVTEQYMSTHGGRRAELNKPELKIIPVGTAPEAISAEHTYGNAFELRLRELTPIEVKRIATHRDVVGRLGVPNYFDEQRFGNLRHSQGWIAKDLMLGRHEKALHNLLAAESGYDAGQLGMFKKALRNSWGDWGACRDIAGRHGQHHSVFDHLRREPEDFAGAFYHVSSRIRLIHLYAFQSHIWNRAVAAYFAELSASGGARVAYTIEGPQVFPDRKLDVDRTWDGNFRLPGEGLEDVEHASQLGLLTAALADEGLTPAQFRIAGVSGFQLKGEDRRLFIRPRHLKIDLGHGHERSEGVVRMSFELPRGAYATLVVRGLLARYFKGRVDLPRLGTHDPRFDAADRRAGSRMDPRDGGQGRAGDERQRQQRTHGGAGRPRPGGWDAGPQQDSRDSWKGRDSEAQGGGRGSGARGGQSRPEGWGAGRREDARNTWKGRDEDRPRAGAGRPQWGGGGQGRSRENPRGPWKGQGDARGTERRPAGGGGRPRPGGWGAGREADRGRPEHRRDGQGRSQPQRTDRERRGDVQPGRGERGRHEGRSGPGGQRDGGRGTGRREEPRVRRWEGANVPPPEIRPRRGRSDDQGRP
jgi:tRNA pseudouridine13 synthase